MIRETQPLASQPPQEYSANAGGPFGVNTSGPTPMSFGPFNPFAGASHARKVRQTAAAAQAQSGQASAPFVLADFNNDGTPDTVALTGSGLVVSLFKPDSSTLSVTRFPIPNLGTASIVAADFNRDGKLDIALTQLGATAGSVSVLLGNGDGTFGPLMPLPAVNGFPFYLFAADLNGDGIQDLALTLQSSTGSGNDSVGVFLGKGDGTFATPSLYSVGQGIATIVAADVNNDGHLDLIALGSERNIVNRVWTLIGKGDGTFQTPLSAPTGTGDATLSYADINHDGNVDLLIADASASAMAVMLGKGDGTYASPVEYLATAQVASLTPGALDDGSTFVLMMDNVVPLVSAILIASDGTVKSPVLQRVGVAPSSIAAGDLNGDGKPDLVITDSASAKVFVELGMGGGAFGPVVSYSVGSNPGPLVLVDVNGDGKLDAVTADANGLEVLPGKGDGTFLPVKTTSASSSLTSLVTADFNGDGKPDIAAADGTSGGVLIFLGKGDGTFFPPASILLGSNVTALSLSSGDLNGDSKIDLIASFKPANTTQPGGLAVLLGNGNGTFQSPNSITLPGPIVQPLAPLAIADFNKDGKLDVVTVSQGSSGNQLVVFPGKGDGTFQSPYAQQTGTAPLSINVADMDGDGNLDVLLSDCCGLSEGVFIPGHGDGTFSAEITAPSGPNPRAVAIADFNADGKPDVALIGQVTDEGPGLGQPFGTLAIALNILTPAGAPTSTSVAPATATYSPNAQSVNVSATVTSGGSSVSGGTVAFNVFGTPISSMLNNGTASATVTIPAATSAGTYTIQATYTPASSSFAASSASAPLTIGKASPVVTWSSPAAIVSGTALSATQLNATANVPGVFTYTPPAGTVLAVGNNQTLSVQFTPTDSTDYSTQNATVSINVTSPAVASLTISKSHTGNFNAGGSGSYTITVANQVSAGPTNGVVSVMDNAPAGITVTAMNGTGWSCTSLPSCTRSDPLAAGQSYPPLTVAVSIAANTPATLTNSATTSGGGSASATATDPTTIAAATGTTTIQTIPNGLQFTVDGGSPQTAPQTLNLSQGQHTIAVASPQTGPPGTSYVFTAWSDGGAASHTITVGSTAVTYTATLNPQFQLNISSSPASGGSVSPATGNFYAANTSVPISATPNSGFQFTNWTGATVASATSASTTITMSAPQTVVANFSALAGITIQTSPPGLQFTIDGGAPQTAPQNLNLSAGSHALAVASPQIGAPGTQYVFTNWNDGVGTASRTITVGSTAATYTANFKTQYQLTISASPASGGSVSPPSGGFYDANIAVPITATAASGYFFANWTGTVGNTGSASTTVTMNQPQTVVANFALPGFTINPISANVVAGGATGSVSVTATVPTAAWMATSNDSFITVTSGASGTGNGTVNYAVAANLTTSARQGTLTVAGQTFTITQAAATQTNGLRFLPLAPCRVLDTRGGSTIAGGMTRTVQMLQSACNIPANAQAYSVNVTVVPPGPLTYLSIWPAGQSQPVVSTLNSFDGRVVANAAIVPAGSNGAISVFVSNTTDVIIDINGVFVPLATASSQSFYPTTPCRVVDTRGNGKTGAFGQPFVSGGTTRGFVMPASTCSIPASAQAYSLNVTVVPHGALQYLTIWPSGQSQPNVSTLN
ncbi:MAG TPA: FG-GAP-like repeat-containing protein, partial [Bryobacteraceae bacterium]|nr:FG-GAP-like repeat-containing protein [Bryobacteraceae bacterium]